MPEAGPRPPDLPPPGWLLVDAGGSIRRADAAACALLGLSETGTVIGRDVRSLVARGDRTRWPDPWPGPGSTWTGTLRFEVAEVVAALAVEMVGLVSGEGWAVRLATPGGTPLTEGSGPVTPVSPHAPLAVADALVDSDSPAAAARAALQALDMALPVDFACVLRFTEGGGARVVAVYPSPMAGVSPRSEWPAVDTAESRVRESGEPSLDGDIAAAPRQAGTPLGRLPGFGLRSRLHLPLFDGPDVAGVAILYRRGARSFTAGDGWLAERTLRRLGTRLDGTPPAPHDPGAEGGATARFDALGDLVAGAAHELNNPLTSILGYAQILDSLDGEDREHALRTIEEEAQRAARIMRNLLEFARQEPEPFTPPAGVQLPLMTPRPAVRPLTPTPEAHEPGQAAARVGLDRILVIDADPAIRVLTSEALTSAGYEVTAVTDGAQGVEHLRRGGFAAVIADDAMRGMDASALAAWIAGHTPELRDRIIFVTGDIEAQHATLPPDVTARYLQRPFDVNALVGAVRDLVRQA